MTTSLPGRVLVVGATSGLARQVSDQLARRGHSLVLAGRNLKQVRALVDDLQVSYPETEIVAAAEAFDAVDFSRHQDLLVGAGQIEGLILCHGTLIQPEAAEGDFAAVKQMIDINFTSCVSLLMVAGAYFQDHGRGFICALSSVAGDRGRPSNYAYGATKAALSAYLSGMRAKLARHGVQVITIKPGIVDTAMTWGQPVRGPVASADRVARDICRAIEKGHSVVYTPWYWRPIMAMIRALPEPIFRRLNF